VLKFRFPLITLSLVNRFTSYSHTLLLRSRPFHHRELDLQMTLIFNLYTDMPHCDLQMVGKHSFVLKNWKIRL